MAVKKDRRRIGKEQLAMAVRKNFNGLAIQEGEVVVDFLYKVRWQGKCFPYCLWWEYRVVTVALRREPLSILRNNGTGLTSTIEKNFRMRFAPPRSQ
jgi:hypothetical protein